KAGVSGVGPSEVITGPVTLRATSNVDLTAVDWFLTNAIGTRQLLGHGITLNWTPTAAHAGNQTIYAVAKDAKGRFLSTDKVSFRVYLGTVYGPKAIATKDDFRAMAMKMSVPSYRETGMAASLQVAQSLLETAHGQSVPVDKYTGQLSYNLFGIKGTGPAGSIISNTWEEYNGRTFRIDANFRAYNNVDEAWRDHKAILLERPWYAPFRAVMTDPVLGAWGLRRSGYATDSQYPYKLIDIMNRYDLYKLNDLEL
ncbi:MAG TPA: glucosaminidase domain-containing protein, partial [Symbiobacteriaceae bacterium]|nr:glucosaminidase domain-containing protein [Symbiobacteriaceae bacterium]